MRGKTGWALASGLALASGFPVPADDALPRGKAAASSAVRDWSSGITRLGVAVEPGQGPWRLVAAALEPDSTAPLCGDGDALFCPGAPLSGGAGSIVFRFLDETGGRLCPPAVRGRVDAADGGGAVLDACEATDEGPIQRFPMLGTGYAACGGGHGNFTAAVDEAANGGLPSDRVTGLGLPNGRPVNIVLTWQKNPPAAVARLAAGCTIQITTQCPLPDATVGQQYSALLQRTGGSLLGGGGGGFVVGLWQVGPVLPAGLALLSGTAGQVGTMVLTGTPSAGTEGNYTLALTVADSADTTCTDSKNCVLTVKPGSGASTPTTMPPQYATPGNNAATYGTPAESSLPPSSGGGSFKNCFASGVTGFPGSWAFVGFGLLAAGAGRLLARAAERSRGRRR